MPTSRLLAAAAAVAIAFTVAPPALAEPEIRPGQFITVAGVDEQGFSGDGGDARQARLGPTLDVAVAPNGTVYIADEYNNVLRVVGTDGVINSMRVASEKEYLTGPVAVEITGAGVLYVATRTDVRRMTADGSFTVVAGGGDKSFDFDGVGGDGGDGGPATEARLSVQDIAVADDGTMFLADPLANRVRRVTPDGTITSLTGGTPLDDPQQVAVDPSGNLYFVDGQVRAVQKVGPDGTIATVLGQRAKEGFAGDGGPAAEARFGTVAGITTDSDGNLYVADQGNGNIRVIDKSGVIGTIGPSLPVLTDVTVGPNGDLYLTTEAKVVRLVRDAAEPPAGRKVKPGPARWSDRDPGTVIPVAGAGRDVNWAERFGGVADDLVAGKDGTAYYTNFTEDKIVAVGKDGTLKTFAGSGSGFGGDGGPAVKAKLSSPEALATDQAGNVYVVDAFNNRLRKIDTSGTISTFAGNGEDVSILDEVPNGDGGPATAARMKPEGLAAGPDGSVYFGDGLAGGRIRKIDSNGVVTTVVGGGERHISNASRGTDVDLGQGVSSIAVDANNTVYFIYYGVVYTVTAGGAVSHVAGIDDVGFAGDGGPAGQARLNSPRDLAIGPDGTRYLADTNNNRVRAIRADGTITTVAGTGARADDGDRGPATEAALEEPGRITADPAGNLYVTTAGGSRIRKIDSAGTITTVARLGLVVNEADATKTVIGSPSAVCVDAAGTVYAGGEDLVVAATAGGKASEVARLSLVRAMAAGPDGSVYLVNNDRVERIYPDGVMVTVAGGGASRWGPDDPPPDADGKRATSSVLDPGDVAIGPSGELYLTSGTRVYRLNRDGTLKSIVDIRDAPGLVRDEIRWLSIAVRHDGELYLADRGSDRVFAVRDGVVRTFAGDGSSPYEGRGDGEKATEAPVPSPADLAVARDGTVYIATSDGIRRVRPDGDIDTVAEAPDDRTGIRASPNSIALDAHGNLYFTATELHQVRVVVRPGELAPPFPWAALWLGLAVVAAVGAGMFGVLRIKGPRPAP